MVNAPAAAHAPTQALAIANQSPKAPSSGGFIAVSQPVAVQGAAPVWMYSPYVGTSVEVPVNPAPDNPAFPACQSVVDCGDGLLGHGAVCDRTATDGTGMCREACRNDADCDSSAHCVSGLDPDGPTWAGCVAG
jgi:hypothetical protein